MSKKVIFFIVVGVVIVGAGIAAYFLFFSDDTDGGNNTDGNTGGGTGNSGAGSLNINPNATAIGMPGKGSTSVNQADTVGITSADFTGLTEDNIKSRNVLTDAGSNPAKIHFTVAFNAACPAFVWYKNWLYAFNQSVQDSNSGLRTCYYAVKPGALPAELMVLTPGNGDCTNFKLYISGVEYKYVEKTSIVIGLGLPKLYCVYKK